MNDSPKHLASKRIWPALTQFKLKRSFVSAVSSLDEHHQLGYSPRIDLSQSRPRTTRPQWSQECLHDLRYALRYLMHHRVFSLTAIAVLSCALGTSIAMFSVVNAVLVRALPFPDSERLVVINEGLPAFGSLDKMGLSAPDVVEYQQRQRSFEQAAAFTCELKELTGVAEPERIDAVRASASLLSTLGISPALGRGFTDDEDRGAVPVALLSDGLWRRKFAADASIVGRTIRLERQAYTVIGILPSQFAFPLKGSNLNSTPGQIFIPLSLTAKELTDYGNGFKFNLVARLKLGTTLEAARAESVTIAQEALARYPSFLRRDPRLALTFPISSLQEPVVANTRRLLWILFGAVAIVLLAGCADLGGLLLTRATARAAEFTVRAALGASRGRLIRQLLTESLVSGGISGATGLVLAFVLTRLIAQQAAERLPRAQEIGLDGSVVIVAIVLSTIVALAIGLAPALWLTRSNTITTPSTKATTTGRRDRQFLRSLVVIQVALAMVLAIGAGLLTRSLDRLLAIDPGFRAQGVASATIALPFATYPRAADVRTFYQRALDMLDGLPGTKSAALSMNLPLTPFNHQVFSIERPRTAESSPPTPVVVSYVAGSYFATLGISLREGRLLTRQDGLGSEQVAVVNETMARRLWPQPQQSAVGQRIKPGLPGSPMPWITIVGVVADVKQDTLSAQVQPQVYVPFWQLPAAFLENPAWAAYRNLVVTIRTGAAADADAGDNPIRLFAALRQGVQSLDPSLPLTKLQTMEAMVEGSVSTQRFSAQLMIVFALSALGLVALGLYGLLSGVVAERTREIGVRVALGARRSSILQLVLRQGAALVALGLIAGLGGALLLTRFIQSLLFGIEPNDPLAFAGAAAILIAVSLVACLLPACRATFIDPVVALRNE